MNWITALGLLAGFLTTIAQLPQVIKILRTRNTRDISLGTYVLATLGVALWLIYGILIGDQALIAANIVTLFLVSLILVFKLRYK